MSTDNLNEKIAQRAYELYLERGCQAGNEKEDWLRAEREIKAKSSGSSAKPVSSMASASAAATATATATKSAAVASPTVASTSSSAASPKKTPLKKK